jgi:cell division initiation protein
METTPNDLRQQQFESKFRGYDPDEVEIFRSLAADALEESRAQMLKLAEENKHLKERLEHLSALEDTLKAAVIEAQKNAESTLSSAKKEAELIVREAHSEKQELLADKRDEVNRIIADINKLRFIRSNYMSRLKGLITSQLETLEREIRDVEADDREESEQEDTHSEKTEQMENM